MNQHLNIFNFYNESYEKEIIENNLSRAFSICLLNDSLLLSDILKQIVSDEDFEYLFRTINNDSNFELDLQIDTAKIEVINYKKLYAIALTSNKNLKIENFNKSKKIEKQNITDIFISIKDIAFIIEVKRSDEDCLNQLYNQAIPFIDSNIHTIAKSLTWQQIVKLIEINCNFKNATNQNSILLTDFLNLCKNRFYDWFEPMPLNTLKFSNSNKNNIETQALNKRLIQALKSSVFETIPYNYRIGVLVNYYWASEVVFAFESHNNIEYLVAYIWPGNTKQQGWHLFSKSLDWANQESLIVGNSEYELDIYYHFKLCHFNKYISSLDFNEKDLIKPIMSKENFKKLAGKWNIDFWNDFENNMDEYFKKEFNWRNACNFKGNFIETDRKYFTLATGYTVGLWIPFEKLKQIDKKDSDLDKLTEFLDQIIKSFQLLIK